MSHPDCGSCLSRRAFLASTSAVAGVAALGLGGCDDAASIPGLSKPFSFQLSNKPELAEVGSSTEIQPAESGYDYIVIVRKDSPTLLRAWSSYCNHEGAQVEWQPSQARFRCPRHNAQYDSNGGLTQGPATKDLLEFTVTVDGDTVTVS